MFSFITVPTFCYNLKDWNMFLTQLQHTVLPVKWSESTNIEIIPLG